MVDKELIMTKPTTQIHDLITGEILTREMTNDEITQQQIDKSESDAIFNESNSIASAKAAQRQIILDKLGITEEEAKILLS
jgi:hypothetical protein